ncbi:alkaline ceramidase 1 isoform X4 [Canis lupus baileyi]|uniref:alkaline ceramidase 1 isoform X4 n=1 Tax=Canis lupus dingo TaxID=286419 RepID=UPI0015F13BA4|nr:alkaline ceramidase 1 isoform X4 [Canis lupus dingo]XP_038282540.1 alkaline ceramidase 1 isoform X4 [Canis lupus familiaris]XP_038311476.1 alkaline ceramidase 1 isoform X4 [Canis lupus familiaris]XP_038421268.1 alkaline ceramidase 1 isoform X4 [Canis lupus familiaris]
MPSIFAYQSSEVDWCESNFQYSELVAEFYNTQCHLLHLWASHDVSDAPLCPETLPLCLHHLHPLHGHRPHFICFVIITTVISTFLSFLRPVINAYALNSIAVHILYIVFQEYKKTSNKELRHIMEVSVILWAFALTSWISDRLLCSFWQQINFFYLHSIWHVLISITFPYGMVTMALVDARYEMPGHTLKVRYWPRDTWPVGLPYVEVSDNKNC